MSYAIHFILHTAIKFNVGFRIDHWFESGFLQRPHSSFRCVTLFSSQLSNRNNFLVIHATFEKLDRKWEPISVRVVLRRDTWLVKSSRTVRRTLRVNILSPLSSQPRQWSVASVVIKSLTQLNISRQKLWKSKSKWLNLAFGTENQVRKGWIWQVLKTFCAIWPTFNRKLFRYCAKLSDGLCMWKLLAKDLTLLCYRRKQTCATMPAFDAKRFKAEVHKAFWQISRTISQTVKSFVSNFLVYFIALTWCILRGIR